MVFQRKYSKMVVLDIQLNRSYLRDLNRVAERRRSQKNSFNMFYQNFSLFQLHIKKKDEFGTWGLNQPVFFPCNR